MSLTSRISAFVELGEFMSQFTTTQIKKKDCVTQNNDLFELMCIHIKESYKQNQWFTKDQIIYALDSWVKCLTKERLKDWVKGYNFNKNSSITVAIIMAGNIPLVGFHDFLSVLIAGGKAKLKKSSIDKSLIFIIAKYLIDTYACDFKDSITFCDKELGAFDAVIATGGNNTARYFEYYFGKYPSIIRKNKNSVAVLTGKETQKELKDLAQDIFRYFGLGCRSVSKLFVPKGYDFSLFFKAIELYKDVIKYKKYANNYNYNKAVYLMSSLKFLDNGFLILKNDTNYSSPIATLFYQEYKNIDTLKDKINTDKEHIQCVVSKNLFSNEVEFGQTQHPRLDDYADGIDTLAFLESQLNFFEQM